MTLQALFSRAHRRFLRREAPARSTSLSGMAWQRFRRNGLSVASLVVIGLFTLTARRRRFFSVALSRGLPLPDVIRHPAL